MRFQEIVLEVDRRSKDHPIGQLQNMRKRRLRLSRAPARRIFSNQTVHERYAFHPGGRRELQFNLAFEQQVNGKKAFRSAVSFDFGRSQTLPDPEILLPKVRRFNEYLKRHHDELADLKIWRWDERGRSPDHRPRPIRIEEERFIRTGMSVYLGRVQRPEKLDLDLILSDFDRLLPLYEFVEASSDFQIKKKRPPKSHFFFTAGGSRKAKTAWGKRQAEQYRIEQHEARMQDALYKSLVAAYGRHHVSTEQRLLSGERYAADVAVRNHGELYLYEIKASSSARLCIRKALGQLLEYSHWPGHTHAARLYVVGAPKLDDAAARYLTRLRDKFGLPVRYFSLVVS